ncbi:uncharacterized protein [Nicotiana sylvestris]|uniref:uncharacterized protein n=1 Tax=Nicotiana sylvestris TaxID=4096 RepID=UPI00388C7883
MKKRQEPPKPPSPKRTVNVISGGEEINGVIYTATKKVSKVSHTREASSTGSSMNIILLRVVNEMQAEDKLIPKAHTLSDSNTKSDEKLQSQNTVEDASTPTSTGVGQTDIDSRPDAIQEPEENENIKTMFEELEAVMLFEHWPDKKVYIGTNLISERKIIELLKANADGFAWSHSDMTGILPEVMTHKLNEDPSYPPVKQKKKKQGSLKNEVIQDEVHKLLKIRSICEVKYPDWLANTVVVPKKNGKWRVSVYYTDLNKACPKDSFPLQHIDQLIDATAGHELLSFLDAYLGYNRITMDPLDEEKTSFITERGTYCYKVMSFGDHIQHLTDTFQILRKFNMKLNPEKCAFGVSSECQQALKNLKSYMSNPPLLAKPKDGEKLLVYLAVSEVTNCNKITSFSRFVADFSQGIQLEAEKELQVFNGSNPGTWTLFTDGSSNVKGASLGIVLVPHTGETIRQAIKCHPITNNEAGYEAVIAGLELARELRIEHVTIKSDSQLVVNQMQGTYTAREARMQQYLKKAWDLVRQFQTWKVMQILREENADALDNLASAAEVSNKENASVIHLFHSVLDQDKNEVHYHKPKARITSTPYHPVGNGQPESTNKVIINKLKKRLEESKDNWPEVLPGVLWAYRTTTKTSTGEIPFSLVYGAKTLIPVEIGEPSTRYTQATKDSNEEEMRVNLDLLKERRENALIRMTAQKQVIERYYNHKARLRYFKIGDYVLKKVFQSTRAANAGKLSPTWEGPYKVHGIAGKGAYELETLDGKILPSNWNVVHLKRYYF